MRKHYEMILRDTDKRVDRLLKKQILDVKNSFYGGFRNPHDVIQVKNSIYALIPMTTAYCHESSKYYEDASIFNKIMLGLDYVAANQHDNGLFDYVTCNFNSAPDTAFCLKKMIPTYIYLKDHRTSTSLEAIYESMGKIIKKGAYGLLEGGFHTPNHRWAIASVLGMCGKLFEDDTLLKGVDVYLVEGIDCNDDGEYAERSAGNYNRINNDAMIWIGEATGDPIYEQYAIKNLHMMLTYIDPDGSIFTANSTRFDKDLTIYPKDYYWEYLYMGHKHHIPKFLEMANRIMEIVEEKGISSSDCLMYLMNYPELIDVEVDQVYRTEKSMNYYEESGIGRYLNENISCTVLRDMSNCFYFHNGDIQLEMKLSGSYFEHRGFKADNIEVTEDGGFHMSQKMEGWYYLPFKEAQDTSDWWKMDNAKREIKDGPVMNLDVWITPRDKGADVRVKVDGPDKAPFRVEFAFTGIRSIETEAMAMEVTGAEALVIKNGMVTLSSANSDVTVGPAFGNHRFIEGKEDSDVKHAGCATVYFTDYTSFDHSFTID